ncbi:MAG: tail fiber domain-containing protein [Saprospiraceae bacterium]|nr:tail fiber domain-containing protein [Candidatus Opimibacter skivensis]
MNDTLNGPILSLVASLLTRLNPVAYVFMKARRPLTFVVDIYISMDPPTGFTSAFIPTSDNIVTNDVPAISIDRVSAEVGIGTVNPGYLLEVNGTAGKPGGGSWTNTSDARLKQNVMPYTDGLQSLLSIHPVRFQYNKRSGYDTVKEYVGVIAQDLKAIAPYMIHTSLRILPDGSTGYLDVDNSARTYMLINAVKEQNTIIISQQEQIDDLEKQMQEIRALLEGVTEK